MGFEDYMIYESTYEHRHRGTLTYNKILKLPCNKKTNIPPLIYPGQKSKVSTFRLELCNSLSEHQKR